MPSHSPVYRRGDPLDIPLIDNHLTVHLLFPRIINAIRWVYPQLYLDWSTGVTNGVIANSSSDERPSETSRIKNPLMLKRMVEILLHAALLIGSSQIVQKHRNDGLFDDNITIRTPAMRNLGMFLRPSNSCASVVTNRAQSSKIDAIKSRIQLYYKLFALLAATVIGPRLYEELKHRRQQQLQEQSRRYRSLDMHVLSRTANNQQSQYSTLTEREHATIRGRANRRRSQVQTLLSDFLIGIVDIFIPPLKLINYISYLWGMSSTPDFETRLVGWNYATSADSLSGASSTGYAQQYQRHANFHYGNRRLLVEEALRTVSAVIPPRENGTTAVTATRQTPNRGNIRTEIVEEIPAQSQISDGAERILHRRGSWFRRRALSFVGLSEEKHNNSADSRYSNLRCSKCDTVPKVPYITSCGHCYCYICLRMAVTDDLNFQCIECGKSIDFSCRVNFNKR